MTMKNSIFKEKRREEKEKEKGRCTVVLVLSINITKLQKEFRKQTHLNFIKKTKKSPNFYNPI